MANEKINDEERKIAARFLTNANKAMELLSEMYEDAEELNERYGWDMYPWYISQSAMMVGKEATGVAIVIGCEDGWAKAGKE